MVSVETCAGQVIQCSTQTADVPGDQVAFSVGDHLVYSHCPRDRWDVCWNVTVCIHNILGFHIKELHCGASGQ